MNKNGSIIIIGRPNVGKSTLFNKLLGSKHSITSSKPHTTIEIFSSLKTNQHYHLEYIDTPGVINDNSFFLSEADIILFLVELFKWESQDIKMIQHLKDHHQIPAILIINKADKQNIWHSQEAQNFADQITNLYNFHDVLFVSAKHGHFLDLIEKKINRILSGTKKLPKLQYQYLKGENWYVQEIIREKIMRHLNQELPYSVNIIIHKTQQGVLYGDILVKKVSHKKILVGASGRTIKYINSLVNEDLQTKHMPVIRLFVKLKN